MYTTAAKGWKGQAETRADTRCQKAKKFKLGYQRELYYYLYYKSQETDPRVSKHTTTMSQR